MEFIPKLTKFTTSNSKPCLEGFTCKKPFHYRKTGANGHTAIEDNNNQDKCGTCGDVDYNIQLNPKKKQEMNTKKAPPFVF